MNFSEILEISRQWIVPQIMINKALILTDIIYSYGYTHSVRVNKDKKLEFTIENNKKKIKLTLLDQRCWVLYNKETFLFNRGNFKIILDKLGESDE